MYRAATLCCLLLSRSAFQVPKQPFQHLLATVVSKTITGYGCIVSLYLQVSEVENLQKYITPSTETVSSDIIGAYGPMSVRPVWDHDSTSTVVFFKLLIAQVVEFNERKQQITLNGWMKQEWQDDFLSWDPADYGDISSLTLTGDEIWFPDTTLYENIDPGFLHTSPSSVTFVNSSGLVSWSTPIIIQSSCRVKVKYFPFDTQICTLTFGSWTMDGSKLQMRISHTQDPREILLQAGTREEASLAYQTRPQADQTQSLTFIFNVHDYELSIVNNSVTGRHTLILECLEPNFLRHFES
ncbi:putative neuronal acetylcholine receptor subunit alpha-10 [Apostichopus japonicus]|uniref:Putative neuronal acetylcholine receptor subunit alpha-10 n=1 Tax=Stichopus japonicus TaxID=307972 RepID=A0A2G8JNZ7_STIJA|nr:putative neuronal acetylcholine receptor subunit alpha-10 [Apostichopus japonicus]